MSCRLACALAYVALTNGDHVTVGTFADALGTLLDNLRGRVAMKRIVSLLKQAPLGGETDLAASVANFRERAKHRGLVVLVSDFLNPSGYQEPIRSLLAAGFRVFAIQVLDRLDWGEGLAGALRPARQRDRANHGCHWRRRNTLDEYRRRFRAHVERLDSYCARRGAVLSVRQHAR